MKKYIVLVLAVLIGVCLASGSFASSFSGADVNRTVPLKSGFVYHTNTVVIAHGGVLRYVSGVASSSNAVFTIYDAATVAAATGVYAQTGILVEGGQATQYASISPIDFGDNGIPFNNGLVVVTTTADISLLYY